MASTDVVARMPPVRAGRPLRELALPLALFIYGLAYIDWVLTTNAPDAIRSLVGNLGYLPLGLLTAYFAWSISHVTDLASRQRTAWRLMSVACLLTASGDIIWAVEANVLGRDPSQGLGNIPHLLYYPVLFGGLMLLPDAIRSWREWVKFGLDAATVLVGGAMAIWYFIINPTIAAGTSGRLSLIISLCYPVGDLLLLLGLAAVLLRCPRGSRQGPLLLLAGSFAMMLIADVAWASLTLDGEAGAVSIRDVRYMVQYVLFGVAVIEERRRLDRRGADDGDSVPRSVVGLPYISVLAGYALVVAVAWNQMPRSLFPLVVGGAALTALALTRQLLAIRENVRLARERSLLAGDLRFKSLIQHASDIVCIVDGDWTIRFVSPSATNTLGYPTSQLLGACLLDFVHPEDAGDAGARLRESLQDSPRTIANGRWRFRRSDGSYVETDNICTNLMSDENVRGIVVTTRDVSERCNLEAQLVHRAFHDPLTGLANRALFEDRVQHALSRRRGDHTTLGVLFVDLDEFKTVNDSLGHSVGDAVLRAAADRLLSFLRAFDTAARLGGDEFAVLIDDIRHQDHVTAVAGRIAQAFLEPFVVNGREIVASASVGVALAQPDQTVEDLLRNADLAMYLAKQRGRGQTALYEPGMLTAVTNRIELQEDLRRALERGELSLAYQPIHGLETQTLVGAEALLRWMHPTRGPIPPSVFVPIAEETGLMVALGRWVLRRACADAMGWRTRMPATRIRVSVNLSGRQIPDPSLAHDVAIALVESGLPAGMLVLEITEAMLLQHSTTALAVMGELKTQGVRLAIDDFGTGYSSLSYLQQLPVDVLKIDREFVQRLGDDPGSAALARTIVALADTMSLRTIAEGVETARQAEQLRRLGCDYGQGFFYGMPMPADELESYASRWNALTLT